MNNANQIINNSVKYSIPNKKSDLNLLDVAFKYLNISNMLLPLDCCAGFG